MPQRVLVTAGGSGIGLVIAQAFAAAGERVHVCDIDRSRLEAVSASSEIGTTAADVSDPDQVAALFDEVQSELGGLDVLVNNAGTAGPTGPFESLSFDDWHSTLAVNLDSQFLCTRLAVLMLKTACGGSIVNISSTAGLHGYPLRAPYAVAKWGVIGLTKTLAMELGPYGIRVNAICPGPFLTPMNVPIAESEEAKKFIVGAVALDRWGRLEEIQGAAIFLGSDASSYMTGSMLTVDGGWTAH